MKRSQRLMIIFVLVALMFALPTAALAVKRLYQARLSYSNELHTVVGSPARGTANFGFVPGGTLNFIVSVQNLSGQPTAMHIHGPATTSQNASVLIPLCSGNCPYNSGTQSSSLEGQVNPSVLAAAGITGEQFLSWLEGGMLYVNVHTSLNPAGEARGQIYPR
jgi:hypothetical protein